MKKGFTLIELLVVIAIIGTLATLVITSFGGSQKKTRDLQRKEDLKNYVSALASYSARTSGTYPVFTSTVELASICGTIGVSDCIEDPKAPDQKYYYQSNATGTKFVIWSGLEGSSENWAVCSDGLSGTSTTDPSLGNCPLVVALGPTPTPPPAPTPTSTPSPTATATPSGPVTLFSSSFGNSASNNVGSVDGWEESGYWTEIANGDGETSGRPGSPTQPFAKIGASDGSDEFGWIRKTINATGYQSIQLRYYWRGDNDAESDGNDDAYVEYCVGSNCTSFSTLRNYNLDSTNWSSLVTISLPSSVNNTTFRIRFYVDTSSTDEHFRVDDVSVTGTPI